MTNNGNKECEECYATTTEAVKTVDFGDFKADLHAACERNVRARMA